MTKCTLSLCMYAFIYVHIYIYIYTHTLSRNLLPIYHMQMPWDRLSMNGIYMSVAGKSTRASGTSRERPRDIHIHTYVHTQLLSTYIYIYIYICYDQRIINYYQHNMCIYIYREREGERYMFVCVYMYICMYIYIYMYML